MKERSLYAVIVKNQRIEGRTKQKVIKYLAHINESDILVPEHRAYFWDRVDQGLGSLDLTAEQRAEIESKLANVVARPVGGYSRGVVTSTGQEVATLHRIREHRPLLSVS